MTLLDELKEYLRVDGDDENRSLQTFIDAAILFLEGAGVKQPNRYYPEVGQDDKYAQHRLAIMMLATHFYENRLVVSNSKNEVPYGVQSLILQLKWVDIDAESSSV